MKFCSLYSGSSGNCIFVGENSSKLLVDAGLSGSRIEKALCSIEEDIHDIKAILITHEHSDHIMGAGILSRRFNIPVFANSGTWDAIRKDKLMGKLPIANCETITTGSEFKIGELSVSSFNIPHDAASPVAYTISAANHKISIATDMGYVTDEIRENIFGSELILLESNHDIKMLQNGRYPPHLKRRILSNHGHLSNESAAKLICELAGSGTKYFVLGHLSAENNRPRIAYDESLRELAQVGYDGVNDVLVTVARRDDVSRVIEL